MFRRLSIGHLLINELKSQSKNEKSRDARIEGQHITGSWRNAGFRIDTLLYLAIQLQFGLTQHRWTLEYKFSDYLYQQLGEGPISKLHEQIPHLSKIKLVFDTNYQYYVR